MVNNIRQVLPERNLLIKFADDTNLSVLVKANCDTAHIEVKNIESWALNNRMTLNLTKTKEIVVPGRTSKPNTTESQILSIVRVPRLNLLGLTFQEDPCNLDLQTDSLLAKASSRLYILRICRFYGYPNQIRFDSLILSLTFMELKLGRCL